MGCSGSKSVDVKQMNSGARSTQPKAPIKLFYLPGNAKVHLTQLVFNNAKSSEPSYGTNLNARFIDIPNQRNVRKYWAKEITKNNDYALAIYLADIREMSSMLLNVKTLNWFLKMISSKDSGSFFVVIICSDEKQKHDFLNVISCKDFNPIVIFENDLETVSHFTEFVKTEITKYNDKKKKYDVSPRSR